MSGWNPDAYLKFGDERTQPARDLAARITVEKPGQIIDLGCGPGNSTYVLREQWPAAQITGLDSSREMIEKARTTYPRETWVQADIGEWRTEETYDIVFSNATLQWIPNHETLIPRLFARVSGRGALAVQLPANNRSPLHLALLRTAAKPEYSAATSGCDSLITYHDPGYYYDILVKLSKRVFVWQTTYYHVMADHQGLIDWYSSTGMKTYLACLKDDRERKLFQQQVLDACRAEYPKQMDDSVLFPFQRLFFIAYAGSG